MGESFKLHSQALIGYVDEINMDSMPEMPQMSDQNMLGVQSSY